AGEHQFLGAAQRNLPDDALRSACARKQAQIDFGQPQPGFVGDQPDVQGQGQFGASAQRPTVDRADSRFVAGFEAPENPVYDFGKLLVMGEPRAAVQVGDVAAGHEGPVAGAGKHDGADGGVALQVRQRGFQGQQRGDVQGIEGLGAIDGQDANGILAFAQHGAG